MCSIAALGECAFFGRKKTMTPSAVSSSRRFASHPFAFAPTAECQTIGTSFCGPNGTASCRGSCSGWPTCILNVGNVQNSASATGTCIRGGSSRFPSKATNISIRWCSTSSETHCGPDSFNARRTGNGEVCANARARLVGRCCAIGPCRSRPTGPSTSTRPRPTRSLRPSANAFVAATPLATPFGPNRQQSSWGSSRRSVVAVALTKSNHESTTIRILPNICDCPFCRQS
jgi:hypothetical protein